MKRAKNNNKKRRAKSRMFKFISATALLCLLYFGIKSFVFAEEVAIEEQAIETEEVKESVDVLEPLEEQLVEQPLAEAKEEVVSVEEPEMPKESDKVSEAEPQEEADLSPKGFSDLVPDGVVYDPEGESFVTIDDEVLKEGEYYYEFLLESITADSVLFSSDDEEYEIPVHSISRLESVISKFEDIYVDGILFDSNGESYVVINDIVAREGDTIGGFLVESIGDSMVYLRQDDLRFEVTIPHFEEESRKLEQPQIAPLTEMQHPATPLDTGVMPIVE